MHAYNRAEIHVQKMLALPHRIFVFWSLGILLQLTTRDKLQWAVHLSQRSIA